MDLKLKNNSNLILPLYDKVEYIESVGIPNVSLFTISLYSGDNQSMEIDLEVIQETANSGRIYYGVTSNSILGLAANNSTTEFTAYTNSNTNAVEFTGRTYIKHSAKSITINGVTTTLSTSSGRIPTIYLLPQEIKTRIYNVKRLKGSTVLNNYIPVISHEEGHEGEACLYDTVNGTFKYASSTGSFTAPTQGFYRNIDTVYVKDCPNIDGIDILRKSVNLTRVRLPITAIGHSSELVKYASYAGFNDSYEPQTKPRLVGSFTIDDYYTTDELAYLNSSIDGLTIITGNNKNIETLLENDDLAIHTLDSTEDNYNPAVAIILNSNGYGFISYSKLNSEDGNYLLPKADAELLGSFPLDVFRGKTTVTDTNGIVTDDTTESYNFTSFNEFKHFTGVKVVHAGSSTSVLGGFGGCTSLQSIELPEGLTSIGAYGFYGCTALTRIVIPSTLSSTGDGCFSACTSMVGDGEVYYNGTLEQWMSIAFASTTFGQATTPCGQGSHFFINNEEITQLVIPTGTTAIKDKVFQGFRYVTGTVTIPNTVTSIGKDAFRACYGITNFVLNEGLTTIGQGAFSSCTNLTSLVFPSTVTSIGNYAVSNLSNIKSWNFPCGINLWVFKTSTSNGAAETVGSYEGDLIIHGNMTCTNNANSSFTLKYNNIIIYGNFSPSNTSGSNQKLIVSTGNVRVKGNFYIHGAYASTRSLSGARPFFEVMGVFTKNGSSSNNYLTNSTISVAHFGADTLPTLTPAQLCMENITKLYVGDGSSRANDEAVLSLYTAASSWASYLSKLATWWDYNGTYKWYYVTDNLTNCTNTNPDEWPHITRENSYVTTIEPEDGYSINSVAVTMLDTDTTSQTYDTFVDITSSVYNSSTGEINIPSVTGNVVITASAS